MTAPAIKDSPEGSGPQYDGLRVTREEYLALPEDGYLYDMIDGVLHVTPSPFFDHSRANGRFYRLLMDFVDAQDNPPGEACQDVDVFLPDGNPDVLRPDVSFILAENAGIIKGHIHGVPDLVCECLSRRTATRDLGVKAERYLANGVREYWIIDPRDQSIQVWYNRDNESWEKHSGERLESRLLPGFVIEVAGFWG